MRHLNTQYFSNNQLKEVAAPTASSDAATKGYVDAAVAGMSGAGHAVLDVADDNNGNISVTLSGVGAVLDVADDNNGNITLSLN